VLARRSVGAAGHRPGTLLAHWDAVAAVAPAGVHGYARRRVGAESHAVPPDRPATRSAAAAQQQRAPRVRGPPSFDAKLTTSLSCDLDELREHVARVAESMDGALGRSDVLMRARIGLVDVSESRVE
jgi:hypothetical protein